VLKVWHFSNSRNVALRWMRNEWEISLSLIL
jgi:hypothetical protein